MDYGYNNGLARGIRGANQFENYLNSLQTSQAGRGRATRGWAFPIFRPIGPTTASSTVSTSPTRGRTSNSRPTRQVSTNCTSSTCGRKTQETRRDLPQLQPRRSRADRELASPRGVPGAQPGTRSTRHKERAQGPRTQRERRTEISWPHHRPRPLTRRAPRSIGPLRCGFVPRAASLVTGGFAPRPVLAAAARPPRFSIAPQGPIGLGLDLGHAVPDWIRQALHLPDDLVIGRS